MKPSLTQCSKSTLAFVLSGCMLLTCATTGMISSDAAQTTADSEAVGSSQYYLLYGENSNPDSYANSGATVTVKGNTYTAVLPDNLQFSAQKNYYFALSSTTNKNGIFFSQSYYSGGGLTVNTDNSVFSSCGEQTYNIGSNGYRCARVSFSQGVNTSDTEMTVTVNSGQRSYLFSTKTKSNTYNVSVIAGNNGSVTVGNTTVNAGGQTSVAVDESGVALTAIPSANYSFNGWTVTGGAAVADASARSTTLTASGAGTVTANYTQASTELKRIYYDNSSTKWTTPYAFAWTEGVANYLGEWPGSPMTKLSGNVWYIDVSTDAESITFSGAGSNKTPDLTVPDDDNTYYSGGTWTTYSSSASSNYYVAALGDTITQNSSLYTNINATFFDYYTDHEYSGSWYNSIDAHDDGWIGGIGNRNPYKNLNTALSNYAESQSVDYPMYFGSFYPGYYNDPGYYHSDTAHQGHRINDSNSLGGNNKALTGLSGTVNTDGSIYHYKAGAANENGAEMMMFNKDWLTSENSTGQPLATIIDSSFPVKKNTVTPTSRVYLYANNWWSDANAYPVASFANNSSGNNSIEVAMTSLGNNYYYADIPSGYQYVKFLRINPSDDSTWNSTGVLSIPGGNNPMYQTSGSWTTYANGTTGEYDYYEFDSKYATNNIYFDNLTSGSPVMQYGEGTSYGVKNGYNSRYSFMPFDTKSSNNGYGKDLGFGVKMEIDFTLGEGGKINNVDQVFNFSGDDDLWVFIDGKLVLDLGGDHAETTGSINFANKTVTVQNSVQLAGGVSRNTSFEIDNNNSNALHTMTLYYMERGMHESNLKFGFSFTPVSSEFLTEKQVSTDNVNQGLKDAAAQQAENDSFVFTHKTNGVSSAGKNYTHYIHKTDVTDTNAVTTSDGSFTLSDEDTADFIGQFDVGSYFTIEEANAGNNAFEYSSNLVVTDEVAGQIINPENGQYLFKTTKQNAAELDPTRIKALFTNTIKTESVSVSKELPSNYDTETVFTVMVEVSLDGGLSFNVYPLAYTNSSGGNGTLSGGKASIKMNEQLTFEGIPVNAIVRITEPDSDMPANYHYNSFSISDGNSAVSANNGCVITVLESQDNAATLLNVPYRYSIVYNYTGRLYGAQTYSVEGMFTADEYTDEYVDIANRRLKEPFLKKYAPYEDNFRETLVLNFADAELDYIENEGKYTANLVFEPQTVEIPKAYFDLPYEYDKNNNYAPITNGDQVNAAESSAFTITADEYLGHFYPAKDTAVEAPAAIYDGGNKINFWYWELYTLDGEAQGDFVARSYARKFNFTAYEDYYVKPVYNAGEAPNPEEQGAYTTITYLEDSRNQWNNGGGGSLVKDSWVEKGDRIYVDFDIAFYDNNKLLNNAEENQGVETGLIIQKAGSLPKTGEVTHYNDDSYKTKLSELKGLENADSITNFISNGTQPENAACVKLEINKESLDNKNRIEYFYSLSNMSLIDGSPTQIRDYIYRAYSYIITTESDGSRKITLSDPVYFNVYATATRGYSPL